MSEEEVAYAIRFFLGREPRDAAEIALHRAHTSFESLRKGFAQTQEFRNYLAGIDGPPIEAD